jgi:hypothetical protein
MLLNIGLNQGDGIGKLLIRGHKEILRLIIKIIYDWDIQNVDVC